MIKRLIKSSLFFILIFLYPGFSFAQPEISFEKTSHDFGEVIEGKEATYTFSFTNTGNKALYLKNVKASCGCTTPYWSKDPIPPGKKGKVKASYNTKGRPGSFNKKVYVKSNANDNRKTLTIKGIVKTKKEKNNYSEKELKQSPKLVLEKNTYNFGKIEKGQVLNKKFKIKNLGRSDLKIKGIKTACRCVSVKPPKNPVKPGEAITLNIDYKPKGLGNVSDVLLIKSNDLLNPTKKIKLNVKIVKSLTNKSIIRQNNRDAPFK